ncbi:MAG: hypothetical protein ACE5JP_06795 [Candidatus Bipolaricaulia bacterium]
MGLIDIIDPVSWTVVHWIDVGKTSQGHPLTREGISYFNGQVYLLPEDGPNSEVLIYQPALTPVPPTTTLAPPKPIVIDTDMAVDDWVAILYLLQRSDVAVEAITVTVTGAKRCSWTPSMAEFLRKLDVLLAEELSMAGAGEATRKLRNGGCSRSLLQKAFSF